MNHFTQHATDDDFTHAHSPYLKSAIFAFATPQQMTTRKMTSSPTWSNGLVELESSGPFASTSVQSPRTCKHRVPSQPGTHSNKSPVQSPSRRRGATHRRQSYVFLGGNELLHIEPPTSLDTSK
uniref:Uncharacterized protein n=1 Tax=Grammatophora oceanica TaxID=210454 RepID=A0A7S1UY71_9STRA|mmetsp:Transcript_29465/g.43471  ORF Transcript_29465/g.43471 Transcript_29465/m.43471 type:complete len:124 (+) Transcript_29465:74-445(+)